MIKNKLIKMLLMGLIATTPMLVNLDGTILAQTQPQPFDLTSHFLGKTAAKFDTVLIEPATIEVEALTGQVLNAELSFQMDSGQRSTIKTAEIAALVLDDKTGKMQVLLRNGQRLMGELLTKLELAPAGVSGKIIIEAAEVQFVLFKDQLQHLSNDEFVQLLDRVRRLPIKRDVLVLSTDALLTGEVLTSHFKIRTTEGREETVMRADVLELMLGAPGQHQLKTRNGRLLTGTIQTEEVTFSLADSARTLATRALTRILFTRQIAFGGRVCGIVLGVTQADDDPCNK